MVEDRMDKAILNTKVGQVAILRFTTASCWSISTTMRAHRACPMQSPNNGPKARSCADPELAAEVASLRRSDDESIDQASGSTIVKALGEQG